MRYRCGSDYSCRPAGSRRRPMKGPMMYGSRRSYPDCCRKKHPVARTHVPGDVAIPAGAPWSFRHIKRYRMQSLVASGPGDGPASATTYCGCGHRSTPARCSFRPSRTGAAAIGVSIKNIADQPLFREFPGPCGVSKCGDGVAESVREWSAFAHLANLRDAH